MIRPQKQKKNLQEERMWAALRYRSLSLSKSLSPGNQLGFQGLNQRLTSLTAVTGINDGLLNLQDVEKVLTDVRADDVKVIPVGEICDWTDHMVIATGRSPWHVKNIAQAIIYKAKEKQRQIGAKQIMLPSVQGQDTGKWVIIDSGKVIIHALDENARAYYDLEDLWTSKSSKSETVHDFQKAFVKVAVLVPAALQSSPQMNSDFN